MSLLKYSFLFGVAVAATVQVGTLRAADPKYPKDPNTTPYCSWWFDNEGNVACDRLLSDNFISLEDFRRWNPSIGPSCSGLEIGRSYCVEAWGEPSFTSSTSTTIVTSTIFTTSTTKPATTITSTTTTAGNGITTPLPTHPGMIDNCNKFFFVAEGVSCSEVLRSNQIILADLFKWNSGVKSDCTGLWAAVNVCVGVIGGSGTTTPTSKPTTTTTTSVGNGIETPQPTQPGMVSNCNKFHWVSKGNTCGQILSYNKITEADFVKWNSGVGDNCNNMWAEVYVCVGILGGTPTTTTKSTTTTGNGITTPTPTQPGMVTNCKKFHYVSEGNTCGQIISYNKITLVDFVKWNSGVGANCNNMWAKAYVCVGV